MLDFFRNLFNTDGFPARWNCGVWTASHGWLHVLSDVAIFGAYTAIPCVLAYFVLRRNDIPFPRVFWLFGAFIFACGFGHLIEAVIFWQPVYRFAGLVKLLTAIVSWGTVIALVQIVPNVLHFPGLAKLNHELRTEIDERKRIADALQTSEEKLAQLLTSERQARSDAERANRIKDEFLSNVSHELRTPLNAILGYSQLMLSEEESESADREGLEVIERNARMQARIIEDLLDMNRIISGKVRLDLEVLDLAAVVQAAVDTVKPVAEAKQIDLAVDLPDGEAPIVGDAARLQQIVWNLLTNAVKFTPKGGRVDLSMRRLGGQMELRVTDSGQGIEPTFLPYVFDRFRQAEPATTRRHGGLGLGLSIAKQLADLHGGSIDAASDGEGRGATFIVRLPMRAGRESDSTAAPQSLSDRLADSPNLKGVRVLLVDDDRDSRSLARRLLVDRDAVVQETASADDALEAFRRSPPDVLVSDVGMPEKDGYDLIRAVRSLRPEQGARVPAIALTAFARADDRKRAMLAGFQAHVTKPIDPGELIAVIASLTGRIGNAAVNGASSDAAAVRRVTDS